MEVLYMYVCMYICVGTLQSSLLIKYSINCIIFSLKKMQRKRPHACVLYTAIGIPN